MKPLTLIFFSVLITQKFSDREFWSYSIQNNQVGLIKTNSSIDLAINTLKKNGFHVNYDSIPTDEDESEWSYFYSVINEKDILEFNIHPSLDDPKKIYSIEVFNDKYLILGNSIKVGDDIASLNKVYTISESYFDYDIGLYLYYEEFLGAFAIELDSVNKANIDNINFEELSNIPDHFKIKSIIVY